MEYHTELKTISMNQMKIEWRGKCYIITFCMGIQFNSARTYKKKKKKNSKTI